MAGDRDNSVVITGNLTRDPELRFGNSGTPILNLSIAVNSRKKGQNGEWVDDPNYFEVSAFGDLAENAAASLGKGNRVTVTGRLDWSQWEDRTTQEKKSKVSIVADDIAASLRWATGTIARTERQGGGDSAPQNRNQGGGGNPAPQSNNFDEEPF